MKEWVCSICWLTHADAHTGFIAILDDLGRWLKRRDPTRPVQYEHARKEPTWTTHDLETIDRRSETFPSASNIDMGIKGRSGIQSVCVDVSRLRWLARPFSTCFPLRIRILTSSARCTPAIRNWWSMASSTKLMLPRCPWSWWSTRMPWATPLEHSKSTGMSSTNTVWPGLVFEENRQADVGRLSDWLS